MKHLSLLHDNAQLVNGKTLLMRATGKFYTHTVISKHLIEASLDACVVGKSKELRIVEPFCGDGRLITVFIEHAAKRFQNKIWNIEIWDCDEEAVKIAKKTIECVMKEFEISGTVHAKFGDSFQIAQNHFGQFDICLTNPPWEILKPDRRELEKLSADDAASYISMLRERDQTLTSLYPRSKPLKKFSGWGTNLARFGTEVALSLIGDGGVCGVVSPASLLADQMSEELRRWIFGEFSVRDIAYYVAEAKLFEKVDQPSITLVATKCSEKNSPKITTYNKELEPKSFDMTLSEFNCLESSGFVLPIQFGSELMRLQSKWSKLPRFKDLEGPDSSSLWAGRELDETGHLNYLDSSGDYRFVKGRNVKRFGIAEEPTTFVKADGPKIPKSADCYRLVWRDVARPSQKRRVHATIIPPGWVSGNSLNIAYYKDNNLPRLKALLAVVNSLVFESQVRGYLATGHISLGAVRQVRVPILSDKTIEKLAFLVDQCMAGGHAAANGIEIAVAKLYGLNPEEYTVVLSAFGKLEDAEIKVLTNKKEWKQW